MSERDGDATAFQLAAELAAGASASSETRSTLPRESHHLTDHREKGSAPRRFNSRSQVERLLDDQRRFALRDGDSVDAAAVTQQTASSSRGRTTLSQRDMYGRPMPASSESGGGSVTAALQEAVLRWGVRGGGGGHANSAAEESARDVFGCGGGNTHSSPHLRFSWHLVESTQPLSSSSTPAQVANTDPSGEGNLDVVASVPATLAPAGARSVGQRWERSDDVLRANALYSALQRSIKELEPKEDEGKRSTAGLASSYQDGLQMCAECLQSAATLPAFFSAASSLSPAHRKNKASLSFFTFTQEEYEALHSTTPTTTLANTVPSASPETSPPAAATTPAVAGSFTYASACFLFELWERFGNAIVVVDRWAAMAMDYKRRQQREQQQQEDRLPSERNDENLFSLAKHRTVESSAGSRWPRAAQTGTLRDPSLLLWVPTVEQACAEYYRVTTGVLQRRQQRLLQAVQTQQTAQQAKAFTQEKSQSKQAASTGASQHTHTPFVSSFDRYALLRTSVASAEADGGNAAPSPLLKTSQPSPSPLSTQGEEVSSQKTVKEEEQRNDGEAGPPALQPSPTPPSSSSTLPGLTPQQRFAKYITPHEWYHCAAELRRRGEVDTLLQCEAATNVPYQHAATQYLSLVVSAAQALQRCAYVFDDRDRAEDREWREEKRKSEATESGVRALSAATAADPLLQEKEAAGQAEAASHLTVPPRSAFAVRLQPLPNVDPAAWKSAEATVRRCADEVRGTGSRKKSGATGKPSLSSPPLKEQQQQQQQQRQQKRGRKRLRSAVVPLAAAQKERQRSKVEEHDDGGVRVKKEREMEGNEGEEEREEDAMTALRKTADDRGSETSVDSDSEESVTSESEESDCSSSSSSSSGDESSAGNDESSDDEDDVESGEDEESHRSPSALTTAAAKAKGRRRRRHSAAPQAKAPLDEMRQTAAVAGQLPLDTAYSALQAYLDDVVPFLCTRLRLATQAGWWLPPPPPLPHSLTNPLTEGEVATVDICAMRPSLWPTDETSARGAADGCGHGDGQPVRPSPQNDARANSEPAQSRARAALQNETNATASEHAAAAAMLASADGAVRRDLDPLRPILSEAEYQELRAVSAAAVCNRVVSHTGEAVLLSLPPNTPRLHREVEQELERYLYDDTSAMMEVDATAQSLVAEIRVAYTQNTFLQRYMTRLDHVVENLRKVEQDCREAASPGKEPTLIP